MVGVVLTPQIMTIVHNSLPTLDVFKVFTVDAAKQVAERPEAVIPHLPWILDLVWDKENLRYLPWVGLGLCLIVSGLMYCRRSNILPRGLPSQNLHEECIEVVFSSAPTAQSILRLVTPSPLDVDSDDMPEVDGEDVGYETSYEWQYDQDGEYDEEYYYAGEDSHGEGSDFDQGSYGKGVYSESNYYKSDEDEEDEFQVASYLQTYVPKVPTSLPRPLEMVLWRRSPPPPNTASQEGQPKKRKTRRGGKKIAEFKRLKAEARAEAEVAAAGNDMHGHCTKMIEPESPVTPTPRSFMTLGSGDYSQDGPHTPVERSCPNWPPRAPSPSQLPKLFASVSSASNLEEADSKTSSAEAVKESAPAYLPPTPLADTSKVEETPEIEEGPPRGRPVITEGGFRMIRHFLRIAQRSRAKDVPLTKRPSPAKDDSPNRTLVDNTEPGSAKATPGKISGAKGITPTKPGESISDVRACRLIDA
ncbi:hypothetical protein EIP86_008765 [Pleurotus ostreatoroseus]|nr:hypothetical protein EIP86_008765 [Pleurotus ostreatoroseus]